MQLQTCNWVSEWVRECVFCNQFKFVAKLFGIPREHLKEQTQQSHLHHHQIISIRRLVLPSNVLELILLESIVCLCANLPPSPRATQSKEYYSASGRPVSNCEWVSAKRWNCHCPAKSTRQSGPTTNLLPPSPVRDSLCHWFQFLAIYAYYANNQCLLFLLTKFNPPGIGIGIGGGVSSPICNKFSISERKFTPAAAVAFRVILLSFCVLPLSAAQHRICSTFTIHNIQTVCLRTIPFSSSVPSIHPVSQSSKKGGKERRGSKHKVSALFPPNQLIRGNATTDTVLLPAAVKNIVLCVGGAASRVYYILHSFAPDAGKVSSNLHLRMDGLAHVFLLRPNSFS